mmetsp:Transcript_61247/g.164516  ORF Transcript_61247/g.164516 Transcript_61247/m.164516 type:complete len:381 (-) Transcript_61247:459-1601(-)
MVVVWIRRNLRTTKVHERPQPRILSQPQATFRAFDLQFDDAAGESPDTYDACGLGTLVQADEQVDGVEDQRRNEEVDRVGGVQARRHERGQREQVREAEELVQPMPHKVEGAEEGEEEEEARERAPEDTEPEATGPQGHEVRAEVGEHEGEVAQDQEEGAAAHDAVVHDVALEGEAQHPRPERVAGGEHHDEGEVDLQQPARAAPEGVVEGDPLDPGHGEHERRDLGGYEEKVRHSLHQGGGGDGLPGAAQQHVDVAREGLGELRVAAAAGVLGAQQVDVVEPAHEARGALEAHEQAGEHQDREGEEADPDEERREGWEATDGRRGRAPRDVHDPRLKPQLGSLDEEELEGDRLVGRPRELERELVLQVEAVQAVRDLVA